MTFTMIYCALLGTRAKYLWDHQ